MLNLVINALEVLCVYKRSIPDLEFHLADVDVDWLLAMLAAWLYRWQYRSVCLSVFWLVGRSVCPQIWSKLKYLNNCFFFVVCIYPVEYHLLNGLARHLVQTFVVPRGWIPVTLGTP